MDVPSEEWLNSINLRLRREGVPHSARPSSAWRLLSIETGQALTHDDPAVRRIFAWFQTQTQAGSQEIRALFEGAFFHDGAFWPLRIPYFEGTVRLEPAAALTGMPSDTLRALMDDPSCHDELINVWRDAVDYAAGLESLLAEDLSDDARGFLDEANRELRGAGQLLLAERTPDRNAIQAARMAIESIAKWFLCRVTGKTADDLRRQFNHHLDKVLLACTDHLASATLDAHIEAVTRLPKVGERYKAGRPSPQELWFAYRLALSACSTFVRVVHGTAVRPTSGTE